MSMSRCPEAPNPLRWCRRRPDNAETVLHGRAGVRQPAAGDDERRRQAQVVVALLTGDCATGALALSDVPPSPPAASFQTG